MRRSQLLVSGQYYHVFNRTIDQKQIFSFKKTCKRAIKTLDYYRYKDPLVRLSNFLILSKENRQRSLFLLQTHPELIDVIAFCLMPNHFHLLLYQRETNGISTYLSQFENSITRYYNSLNKRKGPLFEGQFKAVRIETEEQLLHVHRYIHINPSTSYIIETFEDLMSYEWSSLPEYLGSRKGFSKKEIIMSKFSSRDSYLKFLADNIDYQRKLHLISKLTIEEKEF